MLVAVVFFGWAFLFAGLSRIELQRLVVIVILFLAAVIFFAGFEQAGSSFSLFAERYTQRTFGSWTLAAGMFQIVEPSVCHRALTRDRDLVGGHGQAWVAAFAGHEAVMGAAAARRRFCGRCLCLLSRARPGPVWPTWLVSIYLLHTIGELFLSPVGLSAITKLSRRA